MKKILIVIAAVIAVAGCAPKTLEDHIKNSFETYVLENFGNPDDFIEVAKIEIVDTISTEATKDSIRQIVVTNDNLIKETDSLSNYYTEELDKLSKKTNIVKLRDDPKAIQLLLGAYNAINDNIDFFTSIQSKKYNIARENIDTVLNVKDSVFIIQHKLKVRMRVKEEYVIKDFYSLTESDNIKFYDREIVIYDYPKSIVDLYEAANELTSAFQIRQEHFYKDITAVKQFLDYAEMCGVK